MNPGGPEQFLLGQLLVDLEARLAGDEALTEQECEILRCLASREQGITTKEDLYREVWGYRSMPRGRAVDFAIRRLREKIEVDAADPMYLTTERGRGYRLCWSSAPTLRRDDGRFAIPAILTDWQGSRAPIEEVQSHVSNGIRLLTLHGPAGIGKSRIVIEAFSSDPSARFVRASPEPNARNLITTLTQALGVTDLPIDADPATARDAVREALERGERDLTLIIDGAQAHVDMLRELVPTLLEQTRLRVVLTSRLRLSIPSETTVNVMPLLPSEAESFLIARAASSGQSLEPGPALRRLVEALDCTPLALDLAAPSLRTLSPEALLERLEGEKAVLANPASGVSLEGMVQESLQKTPPDQLTALGLIARFPHGLRLDVVEQLLRGMGDPVGLISTLLDRSLLYRVEVADAPHRFRTTSTVARVLRMTDLPGADEARSFAIAQFALTLARPDASKRVHMPGYADLRQTLRGEIKNAMAWIGALSEQGHTADAVALALSFAYLSAWSGQKREALDMLLSCRDMVSSERDVCRLLALASELGAQMQDAATVDRLTRTLKDTVMQDDWARARVALASMSVALARGQLAQAEVALEAAQATDDPWILHRVAQNEHKLLAMRGQNDDALAVLPRLLALADEADDNMARIAHHIARAFHAFTTGEGDDAALAYRQAIPLADHLGHHELEVGLYRRLALAQQMAGDEDAARRSRLRALSMVRSTDQLDERAALLATEAEYLSIHASDDEGITMARQAIALSDRGTSHNARLSCLRTVVVIGLVQAEDYPFYDLLEELETRAVTREAETNNAATAAFVYGMLALRDGNTKRAVTLARRGYKATKSALGMVDAVYLLGMLATLAAEAGAADAASQWLRESEETYAGDGWDIMRSNCYWHTRAERALKR